MKVIEIVCLLAFISITSCQKVDKIEKPKNLLSKSEMKDLIYDMILLDAATGINNRKLKELDIDMLEFLTEKYAIDSTDLKQNIFYYNLRYDENLEIYTYAKDSIEKLKTAYDSISNAIDSIKKLEKIKLDSISKIDTLSSAKQLENTEVKD